MGGMDTATPTATLTSTPSATDTPIATVVQAVRVLTDGSNNAADTWIVMWATALWVILLIGTWWFIHSGLSLSAE